MAALKTFEAALRDQIAAWHVPAQAGRFVRLAVVALLASGIVDQLLAGTVTRQALVAAIVGAVEVAYRQWGVRVAPVERVVPAALSAAAEAAPPVPPGAIPPPR